MEPVPSTSHAPGMFYNPTRSRCSLRAKRVPASRGTSGVRGARGSRAGALVARGSARGHGGHRAMTRAPPHSENTYKSYDDEDEGNPQDKFPPPPFTPEHPPGIQFEQPLLRGKMHTAVEFFKLFFTDELVNKIVEHTNSYAVQHITEGSHRTYAQADGSWKDTTPDEIHRLLALLIYFGLVKVGMSVDRYWSTKTLYHDLWARSIMSRTRFLGLMALLHVVDTAAEPLVTSYVKYSPLLTISNLDALLCISLGNRWLLMSVWSSHVTDLASGST